MYQYMALAGPLLCCSWSGSISTNLVLTEPLKTKTPTTAARAHGGAAPIFWCPGHPKMKGGVSFLKYFYALTFFIPISIHGDLATAVLSSASAGYLSRVNYCVAGSPSQSVVYMCGFSNDTSYLYPSGALLFGPQNYVSSMPTTLQIRTAGFPRGMPQGASSCTLVLLPTPAKSIRLDFNAFRLSPSSWVSVQEWAAGSTFYDPSNAAYLLGGAAGSAIPPSVSSGPGAGLVINYFSPQAPSGGGRAPRPSLVRRRSGHCNPSVPHSLTSRL